MPNVLAGLGSGMTVLIVTMLIGSTSACGTSSEAAPTAKPGVASCPDSFTEQTRPTGSRKGALVPDHVQGAWLCVYSFADQEPSGSFPLKRTTASAKDSAGLVGYLNALVEADPTTAGACTLMGHDQYQVVLGYADNAHALVRIDYNCGTVSSDGATRRLDRVDTLLAFWPDL